MLIFVSGSTANSFSHVAGVIWGLLLMLKEAGKGKNVSVAHPPAPFLDTLIYHNGMLRNSLQIADLGVREHREQLPPHFRGDIAVIRHAVRQRRV